MCGFHEEEKEKEKELKAEEEEDEDPTRWTLAYDHKGRQHFWHRRTRRTACEIPESAILMMKGDEEEEEEEVEETPVSLIFTLLSCSDTVIWAWTRSRAPWFPHVFFTVLLLWPRSPSFRQWHMLYGLAGCLACGNTAWLDSGYLFIRRLRWFSSCPFIWQSLVRCWFCLRCAGLWFSGI